MAQHLWRWGLVLVVLVGVAAGAYFAYQWWTKPGVTILPPPPHEALDRVPIPVPTVRFRDATADAGIAFRHFQGTSGKKLLPETMSGGVAFFDFDNDGKQDLFFVNGIPWPGFKHEGPTPTAALYRNLGDGKFQDVTEQMGLKLPMYGMGVTAGDYDNDGFIDLFVSAVGKHRLFHNEKGEKFVEVTEAAGVGGKVDLPAVSWDKFLEWAEPIPFGSSCTFLDYDGDGRLDLFVCHYITWSPKVDLSIESSLRGTKRDFVQPRDFEGAHCRLYRNIDGKKFEDVSEAAGVQVISVEGIDAKGRKRPVGKSLGVIVCDPDDDGWPDLMVANDTVRNFFFHNVAGRDGKRRFEEVGMDVAAAYAEQGVPRGGMGIDWGEYSPGESAIVITNFAKEPDTFLKLLAPKPLLFTNVALAVCLEGPSRQPLKFGAFFFDYDLDGRLDLLTNNGHIEPEIKTIESGQDHEQPVQLFWNTGDATRVFEPVTKEAAGEDLFKPLVGRGCAFADIDGDGDLDVVLAANGGPARLLINELKPGPKWARLHLKGDGVHSNRDAIGADVTIEIGKRVLRRQVVAGRGYLSQSELPITVGLGDAEQIDRVTVRWPGRDHLKESWTNLKAGQTHVLAQGTSGK